MIEAREVGSVWDAIKPGIESVYKDIDPVWREWRPEDIYAACLAREAVVFVPSGCDDPSESFVVARIVTCQRTKTKTMHLWIAWCPGGGALAESIHSDLEEVAVSSGCESVEFVTSHNEIVKHGNRFGFDNVMYQVRKDLGARPE
jgi:hypothetical protein